MLLAHLSKILELPINNVQSDTIWLESKNKIQGTYIFINEKLLNVAEVHPRHIVAIDSEENVLTFHEEDITSLNTFIPDCGIYIYDGYPIQLQKKSKRQWKKSFCWSYYYVENGCPTRAVFSLPHQVPTHGLYKHEGYIYYLDIMVGSYNTKGIHRCSNPLFQQEFDEFMRGKPNG